MITFVSCAFSLRGTRFWNYNKREMSKPLGISAEKFWVDKELFLIENINFIILWHFFWIYWISSSSYCVVWFRVYDITSTCSSSGHHQNVNSWHMMLIVVSDSTAQSVLCQPIVQSNGELVGECCFYNWLCESLSSNSVGPTYKTFS